MARMGVQEVQDVQKVQDVQMVQDVQKAQGVQLRPIRGRKKEGELLDGNVGKERLNESAGMRDFLL